MKPTAKILVIAIALSTPLAFSSTLLAASDATSNSAEPPVSTGMAMMPMQQQMAKLHGATNPKERRQMMREHANTMQGMMKMMHGMMAGQGMMGGMMGGQQRGMGMMGGMMGGQPGGMGMMMPGPMGAPGAGYPQMGPGAMAPDTGAMMGRMGMMEQRMNLMQMMMDQMLQQQELMLEERSDGDS